MYKGNNNEIYGDVEETILACLLLKPELINKLKVSEKDFTKFNSTLTFFKEFYAKYKNLDISIMFSVLKGNAEMQMLDMITYLSEIFVLPTHFNEYQERLLDRNAQTKKEKWLSGKIYEKATKMYMGNISLNDFYKEIESLKINANKIDWRK